ncbi:hypothetical protein [Sulfitobacter sp.]|uniref:hypothetical protein n=1 Tax=Sulfitobacter sp. TaxID=1903071 RepID=UPI004059E128
MDVISVRIAVFLAKMAKISVLSHYAGNDSSHIAISPILKNNLFYEVLKKRGGQIAHFPTKECTFLFSNLNPQQEKKGHSSEWPFLVNVNGVFLLRWNLGVA